MKGQCVVFYNLKPKPLAGKDSNGMVLCASDNEHKNVVFLRPENKAQNGKRLVLKDHIATKNTEFISNNHL